MPEPCDCEHRANNHGEAGLRAFRRKEERLVGDSRLFEGDKII